jgi:hypothetical protein
MSTVEGQLSPDIGTVTEPFGDNGCGRSRFGIVKRIVDAKAQLRSLAEPWADTATSTRRLMIAVPRRIEDASPLAGAGDGAAAPPRRNGLGPCTDRRVGHWQGDRTQTTVWEIANNNPFGNRHREQSWGHGTQRTKFGLGAPASILS